MGARHHAKTAADVRAEFNRKGQAIATWAREHGYNPGLVHEVLRGRRCLRGQSHEIAVLLGLKQGTIERGETR